MEFHLEAFHQQIKLDNNFMVNIELHGIIGEKIRKKNWLLNVNSVSEAIRAIEANTKIFYKNLKELDEKNIKYRVLINKKDYICFKEDPRDDLDRAFNSNLITKYEDNELKSIDIIPVIEGAGGGGGFFGAIFGIALIVVGVVLLATGVGGLLGAGLIIAGLGLAAAGFASLLSSAPPYVAPEFSAPDVASPKGGGGKSYLFDGPSNTAGEGGPIPIGYGRLLIGSKTISATYNNNYVAASTNQRTT
jgi:predicted phage tail protein